MTWREQLICRILLIIAGMVAADEQLTRELSTLSTHIGVHGGRADG